MASYEELYNLRTSSALLNKITVAVAIKAKDIIDNSAVISQKDWARGALRDPKPIAQGVINQLLVDNRMATESQILGATDATIQSNVDSALDDLITDLT